MMGMQMMQCAVAAGLRFKNLRRVMLTTTLFCGLSACGGGGGGSSTPPAPPPPRASAVQGFSSPVASQATTGQALLGFRAALLATASYPVQVTYTITGGAGGSSCGAGVDFVVATSANVSASPGATATTGVLSISDANANRQINLLICPGTLNLDKALQLSWNDASVVSGSAIGTIRGSANTTLVLSKRLNDTGITQCASLTANGVGCPAAGLNGQDAEFGRDANPLITGSGGNRTSAFVLTTVPATNCVQDNATGLTWEGKTSSGLHATSNTYTWYNSGTANGGAVGTAAAGVCNGSGCDTEKFVAAVNAEALCGFTDWRLPLADELSNIVDNGATAAPTVNPQFSNQAAVAYWTGSPRSGDTAGAWAVDFGSGAIGALAKSAPNAVRLVRGH